MTSGQAKFSLKRYKKTKQNKTKGTKNSDFKGKDGYTGLQKNQGLH